MKMKKTLTAIFIIAAALLSYNYIKNNTSTEFAWNLPKGINPPVVPADNPMTKEKVELGKYLFYDKKLSVNQTQSCASCHMQEFGFADHNKVGIGATGVHGRRNPNSLTNTGYHTSFSWANPSLGTLERFNVLPMINDDPVELGVHDEVQGEILARFKSDEKYRQMFKAAFPSVADPFSSLEYIDKALSSFSRTLNSFNSPYDKYMNGDKSALTQSQVRGMNLFMGDRAKCSECHSGIFFSDAMRDANTPHFTRVFHNIGLYNLNNDGSYPALNQGLFEITQQNSDKGKFKTPSLRNVEVSFPYMHDGSIATLEEVIDLHSNGGRVIASGEFIGDGTTNPYRDTKIFPKNFTQEERADLLNFLRALTDRTFLTNPDISDPFI